MPIACYSPSKPIEHLVNTDGASPHTLYSDLANEHRVRKVTFALNPDALHRNASLSTGETPACLITLCKSWIFFLFPLTWCSRSFSPVPSLRKCGISEYKDDLHIAFIHPFLQMMEISFFYDKEQYFSDYTVNPRYTVLYKRFRH